MTAASDDRLRVMVIGNSTPILAFPAESRDDIATYVGRLERVLRDGGMDAEVVNHARLFELIHEGGPRFRGELVFSWPDVVIVNYGVLEVQPNVVPYQLVRHFTKEERGGRGLRGLWMREGRGRLWPSVRRYQRWASRKVGMRTWRLAPARFVAELQHVVSVARNAHALVLVLDVQPPNDRLEHFLPGVRRRWEVFQAELRRGLDVFTDDDEVRLVEVSTTMACFPGGGTVDGLHLTPDAHQRVAEVLADEITRWRDRP